MLPTAVTLVGGGGGGPAGGGGDWMALPLRLMRDEMDDDEIDEDDEVCMLAALPDLLGSLSKGLTLSCCS